MLETQDLLDSARADAGLDDYGDMTFTEGLGVLVKSVNEEAGLTPEYEDLLKCEIVRILVNRLRMHDDIERHPEILEEEVLPPVFITSIPRTGSTKLHRILSATGDFNALTYWHSLNFARFPDADGVGRDPRIEAAERHLQRIYEHAPNFQRAHPMYAEEAEEELQLLDAGFNSLYTWAALVNVPSYIEFVLKSEPLPAFCDLRAKIQYLQWQHYRGLSRRWVFKTPSLFGFEGAYSQVFEGTDFIVTHRHPVKTVASTCFLLCGSRELYSDDDITGIAGEIMIHNFGEALKGHLAWRGAYPADKVLDVCFEDIVNNEIEVTRTIYEFLGMPLTEPAVANLKIWLQIDAERKHHRSDAKPGDYKIEPSAINAAFGPYIDRYGEFL